MILKWFAKEAQLGIAKKIRNYIKRG